MKEIKLVCLLLAALLLAPCPTRAQNTTYFLVAKGQVFSQTSAAPPAPASTNGFAFHAETPGLGGPPLATGAYVALPGGATNALSYSANNDLFEFTDYLSSAAALDTAYPTGVYALIVDAGAFGPFITETNTLPATVFPAAPQISNFNAAQSVDSTKDFLLAFQPFDNPSTSDDATIEIYQNGALFFSDTVDPTATDYTVSGGTLNLVTTYQGRLRFRHITPGALSGLGIPAVGFYSETWFPIVTIGPIVVPSNTPPTLAGVDPANGAEQQHYEQTVVFNFSKDMNPANVSISWSATVNGAALPLNPPSFFYDWTSSSNLVCSYAVGSNGWPAGAVVSWTLNPTVGGVSNFIDTLGNPLAVGAYSGSFLASGGPWNCPAQTNSPVEAPAFYLSAAADYTQTNTTGPVPDPASGAEVNFYYRLPGGPDALLLGGAPLVYVLVPLTGGSSNGPRASVVPLELHSHLTQGIPDYYYFQYNAALPNSGSLGGAYPSGAYELELSGLNPANATSPPVVTNSVTMTITNHNFPPTPRFANFAAAQSLSVSSDFLLQWDPYQNTNANSFVSLQILDANGNLVFNAPNTCAGVPLPADSTGVTIPAGTMAAGQSYTVALMFGSLVTPSATMPGIPGQGYSAVESQTRMTLVINAAGNAQPPPSVTLLAPAPNVFLSSGNVAVQFSAVDPGAALAQAQLFAGTSLLATLPFAAGQSNFIGSISGLFGDGPQTATVVVTDVNGLTAVSTPVSFMAQDPAFRVSITSPASGAALPPVSSVTLSATAVSPGAPVTNVDFYMDGSLVGSATSTPFALSLPPPPFGSHTFYAIAEDTNGFAGLSPVVSASISQPPPGVPVAGIEPDGLFHIAYAGASGSNYVMQMTTNLSSPGAWVNVQNRLLTQGAADFFDLQSGADAMRFYRMVPGVAVGTLLPAFSVASALDSLHGTNGICYETGLIAAFTGGDGTTYTLNLEGASLLTNGAANVTLTAVTNLSGYPFGGPILAAVELSPNEAPVFGGGSLTIQLAANVATNAFVAFSYHAPSGELFLVPFQAVTNSSGAAITIPVTRLCGYGVAALRSSDLDLQSAYPPSDPEDQSHQYAAWAVLEQAGVTVPPITLASAARRSGSLARAQPRDSGVTAGQALLNELNNAVLPLLNNANHPSTSVDDSNRSVAALRGYKSMWDDLVAAGLSQDPSYATALNQANNAAIGILQNEVDYLVQQAGANDLSAIVALNNCGLRWLDAPYDPWANSWPPSLVATLHARIVNELTFTAKFQSPENCPGLYGRVNTTYNAAAVFYLGDPTSIGFPKGSGLSSFTDLDYAGPPGCSAIAPNPYTQNFTVFDLEFAKNGRFGPGPKGGITGLRFAFGVSEPAENFQFTCDQVEPVGNYWYPTFAAHHHNQLRTYPPGGAAPSPAFFFVAGWTLHDGQPKIANYSFSASDTRGVEGTVITITHTPLQ